MRCILLALSFVCSGLGAQPQEIVRERLAGGSQAVIEAENGWRFLPAELSHLLADPDQNPKKPYDAIVDFNDQLKKAGIRLIVVPVPAKAAVHPEQLDARLNSNTDFALDNAFYEKLRAAGVEVLDLRDAFRAAKSSGPLYCERDTHWNGRAIRIASGLLAQECRNAVPTAQKFESSEQTVEIQGDLGGSQEKIALRFVRAAGSDRVVPDRAAPVLLLGDSHILVFHEGGDMHAVGAGLPDQLALDLGIAPDVLAVRGSGATAARISLARRARASADYLKGKKIIIWCFGARELTQADAWKPVPILKPE